MTPSPISLLIGRKVSAWIFVSPKHFGLHGYVYRDAEVVAVCPAAKALLLRDTDNDEEYWVGRDMLLPGPVGQDGSPRSIYQIC